MKKTKINHIPIAYYAITDFIMASLAWALFYFVRKRLLKQDISLHGALQVNDKFWLGIIFIPVCWLILYAIIGSYRSLYKKSRLFELMTTFVCSFIGCIVLFFQVSGAFALPSFLAASFISLGRLTHAHFTPNTAGPTCGS